MSIRVAGSRRGRAAISAVLSLAIAAAAIPSAEAGPRYRHGGGYGSAPAPVHGVRRHRGGGNAAAVAAIAGIAALGIGAAIASSQRRDRYVTEPDYGIYDDEYAYEPEYTPPPVVHRRPAPVYGGYGYPDAYRHRPAHVSQRDWHRLYLSRERESR